MREVFLKPRLDSSGGPMVVPDPFNFRRLGAAGEWKPLSPYWARRLRDGDVTEAAPPPKETTKQNAEPEAAPAIRKEDTER
jgi:hypothetical protein